MTLRIRYHPAAVEEQEEAAAWYEAQEPGLGDEFLANVRAIRAAMAKYPQSFALVQGHATIRGAPVLRFPYRLIYAADRGEIYVLALAHDRRRPGYWQDRIEE